MRPCLLSLVAFSFRLQSLLVFLLAVGLSLPFTVAHAQDSAIGLLKQMIAIAADNGGVGRTEELNALKAQIEGLPKPAQGNKQASRIANDKGLAAFKAGQYAQAQQLFLAGYQANAADVELAGNLGFTYIKLGDFKQAVKTLSAALALMPGRSSSWANLAEAYARQGQPQAAVACYALTFQFSQNQNKTIEFLQKQVASADDSKVQQAAQQALQLSLISGEEEEEEMADATPEGESLDAPLPPPAAPVARSLPAAPSVAAAPPVVAPPVAAPAAPPVATAPPVVVAPPVAVAPPPLVAPVPPPVAAAPVTPPPAPSVATSPIPASLPPAASPKVDAAAAALPASGTDTTTAGAGTNDIVEVVAQGMGTDQNSALLNAYSNAVQQALGLYVDAETMVKNDQIVRDQILTYSKGFIQKVDIVSQNQASGLFQVNIRAQVKRQKLMEQAKVNNIALKSVDGASLHGQVLTQVKQEEDAKALLTKALSPFTGVALLRVELVGEPKTVKQDKDSVTLAYPVSIYVDEVAYNQSVRQLIDVLDKIASDRKEEIGENKNKRVIFNGGRSIEQMESFGSGIISIMAWKDKSFTKSKWLFYSLSGDLVKREDNYNIPNYHGKIKFIISLLNKDGELVSLGNADLEFDGNLPFQSWNSRIRIKSYFMGHGGTDVSPKFQTDINVVVSTQDLSAVKTAKVEIKIESKK